MKIRKMIYITIGCIGFVLGTIGAILPILPTFPFLLLATCCFAKSSEKLHQWFIGTNLYKKNLESYVQGKGMTAKTKIQIMIVVTLLMLVGFIMMGNIFIGQIILAFVWLFHLVYFIFGIKTLKTTNEDSL